MVALDRYWRFLQHFFLTLSHRHFHTDNTDFLCSYASCIPSNRQAKDMATTVFSSFIHFSEMVEYLCSLLQTCVTFSGEASLNCREHYMLLFYITRWVMISCEQVWQLLNLLACMITNFPALSVFQCSVHCLLISAFCSEVLGNHKSHLPPWKLEALSTQQNHAVPPRAYYNSCTSLVPCAPQSAASGAKQANSNIINHNH